MLRLGDSTLSVSGVSSSHLSPEAGYTKGFFFDLSVLNKKNPAIVLRLVKGSFHPYHFHQIVLLFE